VFWTPQGLMAAIVSAKAIVAVIILEPMLCFLKNIFAENLAFLLETKLNCAKKIDHNIGF
jgi:hypothetical protein